MYDEKEPITPMGRLSLLPETNAIIYTALQFNNPINIKTLKQEFSNSIMLKIPRFSSIFTVNPLDGSEHWKPVDVDLNNHIIVHPNNHNTDDDIIYQVSSDEDVINEFLSDMAISSPMKMDKPLWELHVLHAQKCIVLRSHHAIADGLQDGLQITGMSPYNLRQQTSVQDVASMLTKSTRTRWGNTFSVILLPFVYKKITLSPLNYVKLAKDMMDRKKQSLESSASYIGVRLLTTMFGSKIAGLFYYNLECNTSFSISNIAGPSELIVIGGNQVTSIKVTSSSTPHALMMHMVGYGEWANLQIQVAKEIISDPKFLAQCFEESFLDMKNAVEDSTTHIDQKSKPN